jgi:tRNA-2-methylthio-N6-dimethylallyladenosine synthase
MLGNHEQVLIEGFTRDNAHLLGRTENNRVVNIVIPESDSDQSAVDQWMGQMLEVKVTEVLKHTLRGEIVHSLV